MEIYVNTDHNLDAGQVMVVHAQAEVAAGLSRYSDHVTRVDVHLSDVSSGRNTAGGKRCLFEACPSGQPPVSVTDYADTLEMAMTGAIHKLHWLLDSKFDRLKSPDARASIRGHA